MGLATSLASEKKPKKSFGDSGLKADTFDESSLRQQREEATDSEPGSRNAARWNMRA
jgi:hypothetical protein